MNERNVEALYELLQIASIKSGDKAEQLVNRALAEFLAGRGVLAPDALTENEASGLIGMDGDYDWPSITATGVLTMVAEVKRRLELIAQGAL